MDHREIERWYRLRLIKRAAVYLVLTAIVGLGAAYALRYPWQPDPGPALPSNTRPGISIDDFSYSSPGAHPFELKAATARVTTDLDQVSLKKLRLVYKPGEEDSIVLTAESGELDKRTRSVQAKGNVVLRMRSFVIRANEISYSDKERLVEAACPITMEGKDLRVSGRGFKLWLKDRRAVIQHDVLTSLYNVKWVEPGKPLPM